jgi:hypothetical protein
MNKTTCEQAPTLPSVETSKAGFFQKLLFSQLAKISNGFLKIEYAGQTYEFGQCSESGISVDLLVKSPTFFRKACLGGSLGVADSFSGRRLVHPEFGRTLSLISAKPAGDG